ncbi:hypothetical protein L7F22_001578 [Adiantum nelumboides]|nr:hypothetical protein [Adiantum nelumboides]
MHLCKQQLLPHEAEEEQVSSAAASPPPKTPSETAAAPTNLLYHLDDFTPLGCLGRGNMGTVFLVLSHSTPFALKITHSVPSKKQRSHVERDILSSLHHPFLQTLHAHFEFGNHSLFLLDFCSGGDLNLLRHRQPEKRFSETAARFYAAEVLLALEHLHKLGIVYRDLKPENILVQGSGHIKLTDFDLSLNLHAARSTGDLWAPADEFRPPAKARHAATLRQQILAEAGLEKARKLGLHTSHVAGISWSKKLRKGPREHAVSEGGEVRCNGGMRAKNAGEQTCNLCRLQCLGLNGKMCLKRRNKGYNKQEYFSRGLQQPAAERKASKNREKNANSRVDKLHATCFPRFCPSRDAKNKEERYVYVVGTDEYVAPEVLRGEEQGFSMDWWSFGILLYEMIYGHTPFKGPSSEGTLCNILEKEPEYPGMKTSAKHLISQLLVKDPATRLGAAGGTQEIKQHPFFAGLKWESLPYICRPPFIPPPLCLSELEERYSAKLKSKLEEGTYHADEGGLNSASGTCKFWLDEVVKSIEAATAGKYDEQHTSSQFSPSSSAGFQSSSADGVDRELRRDGEAEACFSSAEWSSELEVGKHITRTPNLMGCP